jgi:hypothetical protein
MLAKWQRYALLLVTLPALAQGNPPKAPTAPLPETLQWAIGAGNHPAADQQNWLNILEKRPDMFIWLGGLSPVPPKTRTQLAQWLHRQKNNTHYAAFAKYTRIAGTWFWNIPPIAVDSAITMYPELANFIGNATGVPYYALRIQTINGCVEIIMLDTWTHSRPLNGEDNLLGNPQWEWLASTLATTDTPLFRLVVSGKSLLWEQQGAQTWSGFPKSKERLLEMLFSESNIPTLFASGGYPCASIAKAKYKNKPIYELQSNGLNMLRWKMLAPKERSAIRAPFCQRNYGIITLETTHPSRLSYEVFDIQNVSQWKYLLYLDDLTAQLP